MHTTTLLTGLLALTLAADGAAQATASKGFFLSATARAAGGSSASTGFSMTASFGAAAAKPAGSAGYRLVGGFTAGLDAPVTGRPWLAGALPRITTPRSGALVTLSGTELNGTAFSVKIGGQNATVLSRSENEVQVRLPFQPVPGFQPVTVSNGTVSNGTVSSTLPDAIGVLPLVTTDEAPAPNRAFDIVFKGSPGDAVSWCYGMNPIIPLGIPGYLHGLALSPSSYVVMPGFSILDPSGEFRVPVPPLSYPVGTIYAQAFFFTSNAGYAPGAFSNLLRF